MPSELCSRSPMLTQILANCQSLLLNTALQWELSNYQIKQHDGDPIVALRWRVGSYRFTIRLRVEALNDSPTVQAAYTEATGRIRQVDHYDTDIWREIADDLPIRFGTEDLPPIMEELHARLAEQAKVDYR